MSHVEGLIHFRCSIAMTGSIYQQKVKENEGYLISCLSLAFTESEMESRRKREIGVVYNA